MSKAEIERHFIYDLEGEIDLKELTVVVLRRWRIIAAVVVLVGAAVSAVNTYVLTPSYQSSATIVFSNTGYVGDLSFDAFQAMTSSPSVMAQVIRDTRVDMSVLQLAHKFSFNPAKSAPLLTASVKVDDPHLAVQLVEAWILAAQSEVLRFMQERLADRKALAETNYFAQREALLKAEEALAQFDRENPIELLEKELERDIAQLVADEQRLENLRDAVIPADEAALRVLMELMAAEETFLDRGWLAESQPTGELQFLTVNPAYVEIRQRLTALESTLAANRRRVEALEESLPQLRRRVDQANLILTDLRVQRERLLRDVEEARKLFDAARTERDQVLALERQLPYLARIDVIAEPVFSDRPVAPRKMLNLAIGVMLALMISVFGVLVAEWWRADQERATGTS